MASRSAGLPAIRITPSVCPKDSTSASLPLGSFSLRSAANRAPVRRELLSMVKASRSRERTAPLWTTLADTLLLREATACRASRGGDVDPLAGLRIDDATAARTIADLAGDGREAAEARATFGAAVEEAREA